MTKILKAEEFINEGFFHKLVNKPKIVKLNKEIDKIIGEENTLEDYLTSTNVNGSTISSIRTFANVCISNYANGLAFEIKGNDGKPNVEKEEKKTEGVIKNLIELYELHKKRNDLEKQKAELESDDNGVKECDKYSKELNAELKFINWFNNEGLLLLRKAVLADENNDKNAKEYMRDYLNDVSKNCPYQSVKDNIKEWYKDIL